MEEPLVKLIPDNWFKEKDKSSIWITAYRITLVEKKQFENGYIYDFDKLRVVIFWGSIRFLDASKLKSSLDRQGVIQAEGDTGMTVTLEEGWLLIIQPYNIDGYKEKEYEIKKKSGIYASLYLAINGRNMAFERVFDNITEANNSGSSAFSPTFINPQAFPIPDLSTNRLDFIHEVGGVLEKKNSERHRIELSLHWFEKGVRSSGVDSFVNYWVALETLGMPDSTNIKPLNKSLAKAYGITEQEAKEVFGIGKLFGFRSRVLHNGEDLTVHQLLSEYIECVFLDIFLESFGFTSERKAKEVLLKPEFNLEKLVHITA